MMDFFNENYNYIISLLSITRGFIVTIKYTVFSIIFGFMIGFTSFIMQESSNKFLKFISKSYVSIFRGTPMILQLSVVYFALPQLLNINLSTFTSVVIAFSLNSGAYISEIFRSGINAIPVGQFEAIKIFGIDKYSQYKDIILPQIFRHMIPAFTNEIISLTKETAIVSIIGEMDIMRYANIISVEYYTYFAPMIFAGMCYFGIICIIVQIGKKIEKSLKYD